MDINAAGSSDAGAEPAKIAALPHFRTSPLYDDAERAALEFAEAMTAAPVDVPEALFARARRWFDERQLVELAATAATENFLARFSRSLRIEPNNLFCPVEAAAPPSWASRWRSFSVARAPTLP